MSEEVLRADPELRRKTLVRLVLMTAVGAVVIGWVLPQFTESLQAAKTSGAIRARLVCYGFLGVLPVLMLPVAVFGRQIMTSGWLVVRLEQFPPPGTVVLRDTKIVRGEAARRIGQGHVVLGGALIACVAAIVVLCVYGIAVLATN